MGKTLAIISRIFYGKKVLKRHGFFIGTTFILFFDL